LSYLREMDLGETSQISVSLREVFGFVPNVFRAQGPVTDSRGSPRPENETLSLALRYRSRRLISQMVMPVALFSATTSSKRPGLLMN
jgi:hypothetical protein